MKVETNTHFLLFYLYFPDDDPRDNVSPENARMYANILCMQDLYFAAVISRNRKLQKAFMANLSTDLNILYDAEKNLR